MQDHNTIFSVKELKNKIKSGFIKEIVNKEAKIKVIKNWQNNLSTGKYINAKEEEISPIFLTQFFGEVLDYEYNNPTNWNLRLENKTEIDSTKSDAALGYFKIQNNKELPKDVRTVIEIKNAKTSLDKPQNRKAFKGSPVEQAFMYAAKIGEKCKWIIVSNFLEIRLYLANDMTKYESFDIMSLVDDYEFLRFYYLLSYGQLFLENIPSAIDILLLNRIEKKKTITKEFYEHYHFLRELFFHHLKKHNNTIPPLKLLESAQTIIDRIIFISVVKDYELLPYNVLNEIADISNKSWEKDKQELWRQLKKFFIALDEGLPPRIHKFNGGLFRHNEQINNLIIKDVFLKRLLTINNYDFESDLDINILGHIFEQSITDIEQLKYDISAQHKYKYTETNDEIDLKIYRTKNSKRKKDGIYYTSENITFYMVKSTIGAWLDDKKTKIGINDIIGLPKNKEETEYQINLWEQYKVILKNIKILDPACGSGAFLTQAFNYLLREWQIILDVTEKLEIEKHEIQDNGLFNSEFTKKQRIMSQIKKDIINNNIYGVDLNHESVEITKLGLWLKSANKNDPLALLDKNIKCGNSLISDKTITHQAFNWEEEFKEIINSGGFDIIIGNPPYLSYYGRFKIDMSKQEEIYFKENYKFIEDYIIDDKVIKGRYNSIMFFCEKSLSLISKNGYASLLVDLNIHKRPFLDIRKFLLDNSTLTEIINDLVSFKDVFSGQTIITFKNQQQEDYQIRIKDKKIVAKGKFYLKSELDYNFIPPARSRNPIIQKIYSNMTGILSDYFPKNLIRTGITFTGKKDEFLEIKAQKNKKPLLESKKSIHSRYCEPIITNYINYDKNLLNKLNKQYADLLDKDKNKKQLWIGLGDEIVFKKPKLIILQTGTQIVATYSKDELYLNLSLFSISNINSKNEKSDVNLKYILAFLNSRLITYFALKENFIQRRKGAIPQLRLRQLKKIPIILTNDKTIENDLINKVDSMLSLNRNLETYQTKLLNRINQNFELKQTKRISKIYTLDFTEFIKELSKQNITLKLKQQDEWENYFNDSKQKIFSIEKQISILNKKIDIEIYKLFDLKKEEIAIIENELL